MINEVENRRPRQLQALEEVKVVDLLKLWSRSKESTRKKVRVSSSMTILRVRSELGLRCGYGNKL